MRKAAIVFVLAACLAAIAIPHAGAATPGTVIASFDPNKGELPEGLATSKTGTIYVSFPFTGELRTVSLDGTSAHFATLPTGGGFGPLGLAVDAPGNVYVGVRTTDPATQGVYRVTPDGEATRLPGTGAIAFANGLAFDQRGNLYVTDTILGAVWRIPRGGSAELWIQDDALEGDGSAGFGFPLGANGIAVRHNQVFVTVTEKASVVRIPIERGGSAGPLSVLAQAPALGGSDGIALDVHGNIWVPVIAQSTIVRISPDGHTIDTFATEADGLNWASSIAWGTGRGARKTLYAVNFGIGSSAPTPNVIAFDAGVPGDPLP
jgi:sugar lactone lactonase YvrE